MSDDFLQDMRDWIFQDAGLSLAANQVRTNVEGDKPKDPSITLYTGATESGLQTQDRPRPAVEYPRAQLIVRHRQLTEAQRVAKALHSFLWETTPPYPYETVWPMSLPVKLGEPDSNARWAVGFAIRAQTID